MQLKLDEKGLEVYKVLASESRLEILNRLAEAPATTSELALSMGMSKAILSRHLHLLEQAHLIKPETSKTARDNRLKYYTLQVDSINIDFPRKIFFPFKQKEYEVKVGYFTDFQAFPSCGLASNSDYIGKIDDSRSFVLNERIDASIVWLADGFLEYKIPNALDFNQKPETLEISLEIASEFPGAANIWPSDISFTINHVPVGTWTSPGNYADVRGTLTPDWWADFHSQYGLLKHLRITQIDTAMDGIKLSDTNIQDLALNDSPFITIRIGIEADAKNRGGLTIFGEDFGNHPQNIKISLFYSDNEE